MYLLGRSTSPEVPIDVERDHILLDRYDSSPSYID